MHVTEKQPGKTNNWSFAGGIEREDVPISESTQNRYAFVDVEVNAATMLRLISESDRSWINTTKIKLTLPTLRPDRKST